MDPPVCFAVHFCLQCRGFWPVFSLAMFFIFYLKFVFIKSQPPLSYFLLQELGWLAPKSLLSRPSCFFFTCIAQLVSC